MKILSQPTYTRSSFSNVLCHPIHVGRYLTRLGHGTTLSTRTPRRRLIFMENSQTSLHVLCSTDESGLMVPGRDDGAQVSSPSSRRDPSIPPLPQPPLPPSLSRAKRYPFQPSTLESALRIPPLDHQLGTHVVHLLVHRDGAASEVLSELLEVPQELMVRLVWFGAVYYCPVPPLSRSATPTASRDPRDAALCRSASTAGGDVHQAAQLAELQAVRQEALAKWGRHSRHQTPRRLDSDQAISRGGYLRVHMHPKRFPVAHGLSHEQWSRRLLAVRPDHVVVNKPPGLQVPPTVDNVQESLLACVEKALSLEPGSLHPAHRLDAGTEGVVVLARDAAFASYFRALMADKAQHAVRKQYKCLVSQAPPLGPLVHWILEDQRRQGEMAHSVVVPEGTAGAARCELWVEQVEQTELNTEAADLWGAKEACEVTITLITGRTHQVRVQMAAIGLPLLGDRLYTALATKCQHQRWRQSEGGVEQRQQQEQGCEEDEKQPQGTPGRVRDWCLPALMQPLAPIALQAHSLTLLEDGKMGPAPASFLAGNPWWRTKI
ncbi:hypothetical protein Vafri_14874 [Volvox africanus]|uniref:Pseudouridine synthase RsuA/RluA-like domain-containing protein n=1 Tax=Volvox africanus TaxID=51714 RepID=A0A8J4BF26_9CHLO|nr:hypothetical protein Vafri_14874 [Volvox africanus]